MADFLIGAIFLLLAGLVVPLRWHDRRWEIPGMTTLGFTGLAIGMWIVLAALPKWQSESLVPLISSRMLPPDSDLLLYAAHSLMSQFLHVDAMHLLGNLMIFIPLAARIESSTGSWRFAVVLCLLPIGQYLVWWMIEITAWNGHWWQLSRTSAGASGIVYCLFGVLFAVHPRARVHSCGLLALFPWVACVPFWLIVAYMLQRDIIVVEQWASLRWVTVADGGNVAHITGFVVGVLLGLMYRVARCYPSLRVFLLPQQKPTEKPTPVEVSAANLVGATDG